MIAHPPSTGPRSPGRRARPATQCLRHRGTHCPCWAGKKWTNVRSPPRARVSALPALLTGSDAARRTPLFVDTETFSWLVHRPVCARASVGQCLVELPQPPRALRADRPPRAAALPDYASRQSTRSARRTRVPRCPLRHRHRARAEGIERGELAHGCHKQARPRARPIEVAGRLQERSFHRWPSGDSDLLEQALIARR